MNNVLISELMDLSRKFLLLGDRDTAVKLFDLSKELVFKERVATTG